MKHYLVSLAGTAACLVMLLAGCQKEITPSSTTEDNGSTSTEDVSGDGEETSSTIAEKYCRKWVNTFGWSMMSTYYLWKDEISDGLDSWMTQDDPISKVKAIRYKDESGEDIDKWTEIVDDFETFSSEVGGTSKTFGFNLTFYYFSRTDSSVCAVVNYVSADSPAEEAGLKRGSIIMKVNGTQLTASNFSTLYYSGLSGESSSTLTLLDGSEVSMDPVEMYEDPVFLTKVFDIDGKKVGYIVYNAFVVKSCERLIEVCKEFKEEGVTELILDLRYNGGGYVYAEETLASMLAPQEAVEAKSVFETEIYNADLTKAWGNGEDCFTTEFNFTTDGVTYNYSTEGANIGLDKMYVIYTGGSASASESLVVGLKPYLDIEIVGEQSYGKYCSGILYSTDQWLSTYKKYLSNDQYNEASKYALNWGIYLMISRFADKDGNTPCMPDGFTPDIAVEDNPADGYQLGDPYETMLHAALISAGATFEETKTPARGQALRHIGTEISRPGRTAMRILPEEMFLRQ